MRDTELLNVVKELLHFEQFGAEEVWLGYNADDELVKIRKKIDGRWYERTVQFAGVTDLTPVKWDKIYPWEEV